MGITVVPVSVVKGLELDGVVGSSRPTSWPASSRVCGRYTSRSRAVPSD